MVLESGPGISAVLYCQSAACATNGMVDLVVIAPTSILFFRVFFFCYFYLFFYMNFRTMLSYSKTKQGKATTQNAYFKNTPALEVPWESSG